MSANFLVAGEVKEYGSTLEVRGPKDRTQSLSNVDILISPCDPPHTDPASPQSGPTDASEQRPAEKTQLEAAASFPLERSKVTQRSPSPTLSISPSSNKKSISSVICSPTPQDQQGAPSQNPPASQRVSRSPSMPGCRVLPSSVERSQDDETKQEVEEGTSGPSGGEQVDDTANSHHGNKRGGESSEEELLLGEDKMYPTLRSKSLNTNPRKMRTKKEGEETLRSSGSVKDLVSAFSRSAGGLRSRTRSRDSDC